jgi:L-aspartate oxidase
MSTTGADHVWLDATALDHFADRFPTIAADLVGVGLDPSSDWLPVAPAAHHQCGGIVTDLHGASTLPGLWAAGETSCTGVHGANRLASNSLLEGMVFGPRAVEAIAGGADGPTATGAMSVVLGAADQGSSDDLRIGWATLEVPPPDPGAAGDANRPSSPSGNLQSVADELRRTLQQSMSADAGVLRDAERLERCRGVVDGVLASLGVDGEGVVGVADIATAEVRNLAEIARVLVAAASARTESRGAHARVDHPDLDPAQCRRLVVGGPTDAVQHSHP